MPTSIGPPTDAAQIPGLPELWTETLGDPRICIAILDGPVDLSHPSLGNAAITQLTTDDVTESRSIVSDHGTHVASIIFGQHDSEVKGVAPHCRGLIIPIFDYAEDGSLKPSTQSRLAKAIRVALRHGADIINISAGQFSSDGEASEELKAAVRECEGRALIVAAAGNDGCECLHVPGALPSVLAVGAMNLQGEPLPFSNWGAAYQEHGLLAPGERITGASLNGRVAQYSGTSFATPIVSGVAGLALSTATKTESMPSSSVLRAALLGSTVSCAMQPTSDCSKLLSGRLNVSGVLQALERGRDEMHETSYSESTNANVPVAPAANMSQPSAGEVQASDCGCGCQAFQQGYVYPIGLLAYEFPSYIREESIRQNMEPLASEANDPDPTKTRDFLRHLLGFRETELDVEVGRILSVQNAGGDVLITVDRAVFDPSDEDRRIEIEGVKIDFGTNDSVINGRGVVAVVAGQPNQFKLKYTNWTGETFTNNTGEFVLVKGHTPAISHSAHPYDAQAASWTLIRDRTPMYLVLPQGCFSAEAYDELATFLLDQAGQSRESLDAYYYQLGGTKIQWKYNWDPRYNADSCHFANVPALIPACGNYRNTNSNPPELPSGKDTATHLALPGTLGSAASLREGRSVPTLVPDMRGTANWSLARLIEDAQITGVSEEWIERVSERLFEEVRNPGRSGEDRALNHASTQLISFLAEKVKDFTQPNELELDTIQVAAVSSTRQDSAPYTVEASFLNPEQLEKASVVVSVTIDVNDVVPIVMDGPRTFRRRT